MKKFKKISAMAITVSLLALTFTGCSSQASSSNTVAVKVAAADKGSISTNVDVTGVLVPGQTVNVSSMLPGPVKSISVDVGSTVKSGQSLISIDTKSLDAQLNQAEAALKYVDDQASEAKTNLDLIQQAYDQTKQLVAEGQVPQSQLDDLQGKLQLAQQQYDIAKGSAHNQAEAAVETVETQLSNANITSPISGIVTNRNVNPGEMAGAGIPLLTIANTSTLELKGTIPQTLLPLISQGQEVTVTVDAYPGKQFQGKVSEIGPMSVSTGAYFPIEITMDNTDNIMAGLTAHAALTLSSSEGIVIPSSAVVKDNGKSYVYVIDNGAASKREVTTGLSSDTQVMVTSGLNAGDKVAVTNVNALFDKMQVTAQ